MCHSENMDGLTDRSERMTPRVLSVRGIDMKTWSYAPPQGQEAKGLVVMGADVFGPSPFYQEVAGRLADNGYTVCLVDACARDGELADNSREAALARLSGMNEPENLADVNAALDLLKSESGEERVGFLGFCLTGLFGFNLAAQRSDLAIVCFYGFPDGVQFPPNVDAPSRVTVPKPLDQTESFTGPVRAFWGNEDYSVPVATIEAYSGKLKAVGADYEAKVYPGVGHGFLDGLVESNKNSEAARDAWHRAVMFFDEQIG